ncbi:hypothetical protein M404DRAFT_32253 [Pisolithus tinctorius Marx 270]|uniref:CxC1-like cysteine cluster associated with KDZ transposases domain-containing protein n=1 Tax=Pisolithus tinctorius Marx 270 TaxID=870435 RepID=A0A0C3NQD2_PISTI|nr:hypothetical protein M404DRAFT_32253 [Pisolithus tinctorius Marx 270]
MAITINALELYRVAHLCSLHFSIQAFVKTICDLQGVAFQHYLSCQFSIMLNLYLNILNGVEALIMEALSRTSDDWHLQHACPACTYKLKDKPHLKFKILYAMDGNDSLKHILHHIMEDEDSHELPTTQKVPMTCYLSCELVDSFAQSAPIQSTQSTSKDIKEEQSYLEGLEMEPLNETLQMEYWQALVNLEASKKDLDLKSVLWDVTTPSDLKDYATYMCKTQKAETAHWHAIDMYNEDLHIVQDLKSKLNIDSCWTPKQPEWHDAAHLVTKRTFQHALDHLEALIIMQIFELLKMNCAGTRYKMQKHIVKVLQVHSSAICIALEQYNTAAHAMDPPHCILKWDEVAEYAFITEFDLLRDAWQDVSQ